MATLTGAIEPATAGTLDINLYPVSDFFTQLNTDLDNTFFNNTEWAQQVEYTHDGGTEAQTYNIIYDDPEAPRGIGGDADVFMQQPQFMMKRDILRKDIRPGDTVKINGITRRVENYDDNGVGVVTIYLEKDL